MTGAPEGVDIRESCIKGALCYALPIGWVISLFFILTEKDDRYVRFNALQGLLLLLSYVVLLTVLSLLPETLFMITYMGFIIRVVSDLLFPAYLALSLLLIYKTYTGKRFILPRIGVLSDKHV